MQYTFFIRTAFIRTASLRSDILKNIHARCKMIRKTKRGDHIKHFKHIIQGGVKVENWSQSSSKVRTTEPQPKITGPYKEKCIWT